MGIFDNAPDDVGQADAGPSPEFRTRRKQTL